MNEPLAKEAGSALFWKAVQQGGVNLIFLVRLLILARLLAPADFGLLAIAITGVGILLRITDFGMIPALVQRTEVNNQHYDAAWTVGILRAVTIAGMVFLTAPFIAEIFGEPKAINIIRALAILPLLEAAASIKIAELTRTLCFRTLGIAKLTEALTNTIISIFLASSLGVWALVAGAMTGSFAYIIISYVLAPHRPRLSFDRDAAWSLIRYGQWIFVTGLITVSGGAILRVVISRQLGVAELGLYFLAAKLAFLPNEMAGEVVGNVAFPLYANLQSNIRQTAKAFRAVFTGMLLILIPVFALIITLAPSLVDNVLGVRWEGTVPLIRLLAIAGIIGLIGDAVVPVLKGLGQPYKFAILEAAQSLLLIMFAWAFTEHFGLIGVGYAWFPAVIGSGFAGMLFLRQILHFPFTGLGSSLIAIAIASTAGAFIALHIGNSLPGIFGFSIATLTALGSIGMILWLSDRAFELGLSNDLVRAFPQAARVLGIKPVNN